MPMLTLLMLIFITDCACRHCVCTSVHVSVCVVQSGPGWGGAFYRPNLHAASCRGSRASVAITLL
jgi:hypothetical protein